MNARTSILVWVGLALAPGVAGQDPAGDESRKANEPLWTTDEVRERWLRDAPEDLHEDFVKDLKRRRTAKRIVVRTKHYIVLTNSSSGATFGKKMEENYEAIRKVFPFEEKQGERLMPVFLFRTPQQYYDFYVKVTGTTMARAKRSKGHAWRDYYATWYEAPGDPVHIHEATHQIFSNRLRLGGGGSWFQEGVAGYIETKPNDRNPIANVVKRGRHTPLREFFELRSLLHSSNQNRKSGGSEASDHYKQAALLIEFLRESRAYREKFQDFVNAMGQVRRNDLEAIAKVLDELYGQTIEELDEEFQRYCKKR